MLKFFIPVYAALCIWSVCNEPVKAEPVDTTCITVAQACEKLYKAPAFNYNIIQTPWTNYNYDKLTAVLDADLREKVVNQHKRGYEVFEEWCETDYFIELLKDGYDGFCGDPLWQTIEDLGLWNEWSFVTYVYENINADDDIDPQNIVYTYYNGCSSKEYSAYCQTIYKESQE